MSKIKSILRFAMRMEKDAADFYEFYMGKAESEDVKALFSELAEVEKKHYGFLKKKFDELEFSEPPQTISWVVDESFKSRDPHILSDNSDTLPSYSGDSSDLSIIRMAFLIEHDFAYFYSKAADTTDDPDAKKFLNELAGWEKQHSDLFQHRYQALLEKSWNDIADLLV